MFRLTLRTNTTTYNVSNEESYKVTNNGTYNVTNNVRNNATYNLQNRDFPRKEIRINNWQKLIDDFFTIDNSWSGLKI